MTDVALSFFLLCKAVIATLHMKQSFCYLWFQYMINPTCL